MKGIKENEIKKTNLNISFQIFVRAQHLVLSDNYYGASNCWKIRIKLERKKGSTS